jgi:hypothetical protein
LSEERKFERIWELGQARDPSDQARDPFFNGRDPSEARDPLGEARDPSAPSLQNSCKFAPRSHQIAKLLEVGPPNLKIGCLLWLKDIMNVFFKDLHCAREKLHMAVV